MNTGSLVVGLPIKPSHVVFRVLKLSRNGWLTCQHHSDQVGNLVTNGFTCKFRTSDVTEFLSPPNGYDLAFVEWFDEHGWQIRSGTTIEVWTNNDATCRFQVTRQMVERLARANLIRRIFPSNAGNDEVYSTNGHQSRAFK